MLFLKFLTVFSTFVVLFSQTVTPNMPLSRCYTTVTTGDDLYNKIEETTNNQTSPPCDSIFVTVANTIEVTSVCPIEKPTSIRCERSDIQIDCTKASLFCFLIESTFEGNLTIIGCKLNRGIEVRNHERGGIVLMDCVFDGANLLYPPNNAKPLLTNGFLFMNKVPLIVIVNTVFQNNKATKTGGCVSVLNTTYISLVNVTMNNCVSNFNGGCLYINAQDPSIMPALTHGEIFVNNLTLTRCQLSVSGDGGGLYAIGFRKPVLHNVVISQSKTMDHGGCMSLESFDNGVLENVTAEHCYSKSGSSSGGGIKVNGGNLLLRNITVRHSETLGSGGCLRVYLLTGPVRLENVVLENCTSQDRGGCLIVSHSYDVFLKNISVRNCEAQIGAGVHVESMEHVTIANISVQESSASLLGSGLFVNNTKSVKMSDVLLDTVNNGSRSLHVTGIIESSQWSNVALKNSAAPLGSLIFIERVSWETTLEN
eukprot:PhF_6_TR27817/c0_g1_i2/m.40573